MVGKKWGAEEKAHLVSSWRQIRKQFGEGKRKHSNIWEDLSTAMVSVGYIFDSIQCKNQMQHLLGEYKQCAQGEKKSGNGAQTKSEFFDEIYEELGHTAYTNAKVVCAVGCENVVRRRLNNK